MWRAHVFYLSNKTSNFSFSVKKNPFQFLCTIVTFSLQLAIIWQRLSDISIQHLSASRSRGKPIELCGEQVEREHSK